NRSPLAADQRKMLGLLPARRLGGFSLPGILRESPENGLRKLADSAALLGSLAGDAPAGLLVEQLHSRVRSAERSIQNEALVKLLQQFRDRDVAPKALLLTACFGIRRYDPFLHDPKLANLLSRANKEFAPWASFSTKGDKVYATLKSVEWKEESLHTKCFEAVPEVWDLLLPGVAAAAAPGEKTEAARRLVGEWSTRAQFEALLGLSRASANRWIVQWVERGLLEKDGAGKNTRYRATEALIPEIEKILDRSSEVSC
ncbi:MAG: hypothetical protein HUU37_01355, partial [Bdellovibrionales bacterium]|nr:hypothetical protein [Bdellovibrionales bacterium]